MQIEVVPAGYSGAPYIVHNYHIIVQTLSEIGEHWEEFTQKGGRITLTQVGLQQVAESRADAELFAAQLQAWTEARRQERDQPALPWEK